MPPHHNNSKLFCKKPPYFLGSHIDVCFHELAWFEHDFIDLAMLNNFKWINLKLVLMIILNAVRLTPIKMVEICAFFLFLGALLKSFIFSKQHFKCPFLTRIFIYVFILGLGRMDMIRRNWRNISSIIINLLKCKILNYHKINGNFKSCKHKLLLIRICCTFINCII